MGVWDRDRFLVSDPSVARGAERMGGLEEERWATLLLEDRKKGGRKLLRPEGAGLGGGDGGGRRRTHWKTSSVSEGWGTRDGGRWRLLRAELSDGEECGGAKDD